MPIFGFIAWIGAWLYYIAFHNRKSIQIYFDLAKSFILVSVSIAILSVISVLFFQNNESTNINNLITYGSQNIMSVILACFFLLCSILIEIYIALKWKHISIRYHFFGIQLAAVVGLILIFGCLNCLYLMYASMLLLLLNITVLWNEEIHKEFEKKRIMLLNNVNQNFNAIYVKKWRPIRDNICIRSCGVRGLWVFKIYTGLIFGRIHSPKHSYKRYINKYVKIY